MSSTRCPAALCENMKHPRDFLCAPHMQRLDWRLRTELAIAWQNVRIGGARRRLERAESAALEAANRVRLTPTVFGI